MRKVWEHGSKLHREQTFISVLFNWSCVCVNIICSDSLLFCCIKYKRLIINISRFVCFTFHVTKKTIPWMRTNSSTLLFSGWMYVQIQWLNETLLIMNKTQSTFLLCLDVLVLWWMIEEQEMIVSFWLKRNRWEWGKCENMLQNHTENKHSSLFFSNGIVCV